MGELRDKVIVITGGGRGIGYAAAQHCLEQGAYVVVAESAPQTLQNALNQLAVYGDRVHGILASVASWDDAHMIMHETVSRYGRLDGLVNNAAITQDRLLSKMSESQFDEVLATNLKGPFNCVKAALPHMKEQGGGRIINMIAASGLVGNIGQTNYAAAKGGLLAMTLTWSRELVRSHIMVNALIPAAWTEMSASIPQEALIKAIGKDTYEKLRSRKPEQVAPVVAYLLSDRAEGVTGQCIGIAGRELSIWQYATPKIVAQSVGDAWTIAELDQWIERQGEGVWSELGSPFI